MNWSIDMEEQYDKLYRYCYFKLGSREAAEDVTQEAFLRFLGVADAVEKNGEIDRNDRNNNYELSYLYAIAKNLCVDEFRRRRPEGLWEEECEALSEPDRTGQVVESVLLKSALARLAEEEREMLLLRYANEVPLSELCRLYRLSRFAVHRKLKKALKKLREMMA